MPSMYGKYSPERSNSGGGHKRTLRTKEETQWREEVADESIPEDYYYDILDAFWDDVERQGYGDSGDLAGTGIGYRLVSPLNAFQPTKIPIEKLA